MAIKSSLNPKRPDSSTHTSPNPPSLPLDNFEWGRDYNEGDFSDQKIEEPNKTSNEIDNDVKKKSNESPETIEEYEDSDNSHSQRTNRNKYYKGYMDSR